MSGINPTSTNLKRSHDAMDAQPEVNSSTSAPITQSAAFRALEDGAGSLARKQPRTFSTSVIKPSAPEEDPVSDSFAASAASSACLPTSQSDERDIALQLDDVFLQWSFPKESIPGVNEFIEGYLSIGDPGVSPVIYKRWKREIEQTSLARFIIEEDGPVEVQLQKAQGRWLKYLALNHGRLTKSFKEADANFFPNPADLTKDERASYDSIQSAYFQKFLERDFEEEELEPTQLATQLLVERFQKTKAFCDLAALDQNIEKLALFRSYWIIFEGSPEMRALLDQLYDQDLTAGQVADRVRAAYSENQATILLSKPIIMSQLYEATTYGNQTALQEVFWLILKAPIALTAAEDFMSGYVDVPENGLPYMAEAYLRFAKEKGDPELLKYIADNVLTFAVWTRAEPMPGLVNRVLRLVKTYNISVTTDTLTHCLGFLSTSAGNRQPGKKHPELVCQIQQLLLNYITENNLILALKRSSAALKNLEDAIKGYAGKGYEQALKDLIQWMDKQQIGLSPTSFCKAICVAGLGRHTGISDILRRAIVKRMEANPQFKTVLGNLLDMDIDDDIDWGKRSELEDDEVMRDGPEIESDTEMTDALIMRPR